VGDLADSGQKVKNRAGKPLKRATKIGVWAAGIFSPRRGQKTALSHSFMDRQGGPRRRGTPKPGNKGRLGGPLKGSFFTDHVAGRGRGGSKSPTARVFVTASDWDKSENRLRAVWVETNPNPSPGGGPGRNSAKARSKGAMRKKTNRKVERGRSKPGDGPTAIVHHCVKTGLYPLPAELGCRTPAKKQIGEGPLEKGLTGQMCY